MNPTFRVSSGLIEPKHLRRMGASLEVYLWCVDHQTNEAGMVMHGRVVKISRIAEAIGQSLRRTQEKLARLTRLGYLNVVRRSRGVEILILNQKKWPASDRQVIGRKCPITGPVIAGSVACDRGVCDRGKRPITTNNGRARDLHLKTATTTEREIFTPATPRDPAPALRVVTSEDRSEEANLGPPFDDAWKASTRAHLETRGWRCCISCITGWANLATKLCDDCEWRPRLVPAREGHA